LGGGGPGNGASGAAKAPGAKMKSFKEGEGKSGEGGIAVGIPISGPVLRKSKIDNRKGGDGEKGPGKGILMKDDAEIVRYIFGLELRTGSLMGGTPLVVEPLPRPSRPGLWPREEKNLAKESGALNHI